MMISEFEQLTQIIKNRRAVYPDVYRKEKIDDRLIHQILENANWAPTHRKTEPWRFHVFAGEALRRLSEYMAEYYRIHTPESEFSEFKFQKTRKKALQSSHVLAICMQRDPEERLPEWEEKAAVACAVMNMWLSCTALGIGCYWSTPQSALDAGDFLGLNPGEQCLGWFYMGYPKKGLELSSARGKIEEKVVWHQV